MLGKDDGREEMDELMEFVFHTVNNGVYKAGFATTQEAYEEAVTPLFETLDDLTRAPVIVWELLSIPEYRAVLGTDDGAGYASEQGGSEAPAQAGPGRPTRAAPQRDERQPDQAHRPPCEQSEPGETGTEAQHAGQFRRRRAGARLQQRRGTGEQTGTGQKQDGEADGVRRVDRTGRGRAGR